MRKYFIVGVLLLVLATPLVIAFIYQSKKVYPKSITLNYWTVDERPEDLAGVINAYRSYHPYVKIDVKRFNLEAYEDALIQGWARDQGPDIFSVPNTWLKKYQEFITPMPATTKVAYYTTRKFLFKSTTDIKYITKNSMTITELKNNYIDTIYEGVVLNDAKNKAGIYGLPESIDTLALFYNKDLLSGAYIIDPAKTWTELVQQVGKLTKLDDENNIVQSAIPLGLTDTVSNYFGIVSLLMMQNGTEMISADGTDVAFDKTVQGESLAGRALDYYVSFADFNKETYSWDNKLGQDIDAFKNGKAAYYIGTYSQKREIDESAPGLNYGISPMLHINPDSTDRVLNRAGNPVQVNYGTYWVETVAKKTKSLNEAWDFVQFISRENRNKEYLKITGEISPLKNVLKEQIKNPDQEIWANQALTAKSWYKGRDATKAETYFKEMIDAVIAGMASQAALAEAAEKIQTTL